MSFSSFLEKPRIILMFDELRSINHDSWFFSKGRKKPPVFRFTLFRLKVKRSLTAFK